MEWEMHDMQIKTIQCKLIYSMEYVNVKDNAY